MKQNSKTDIIAKQSKIKLMKQVQPEYEAIQDAIAATLTTTKSEIGL
jgi:hypothetical protein